MKPIKKISVIIPVLNDKNYLHDLLSQLRVFRSLGHEVIVVDGGSTDGCREWLHTVVDSNVIDKTKILIDSVVETNPGRAIQMNAGAAIATGNLVWFLHADTTINIQTIGDLIALLAKPGLSNNSDNGVWGWFNIRLSGRAMSLRLIERMMNLRSRVTGIATGDQGIFVSSSLFEQAGRFPAIALMEDIAFSKSLRRLSRPVHPKNKLTSSSRRWEKHGIWKTVFLMWRLRLAYALGADPAKLSQLYRNHK